MKPVAKMPPSPRETLLQEAIQITTSDRNKQYGDPEDNFRNIAELWIPYFKQRFGVPLDITPQDVAHLMILFKIARLSTNPGHRDSILDAAGYAACAEDCRIAAARNSTSVSK